MEPTDVSLPELPPMGYGNDGWCQDSMEEYGLSCYRAGLEKALQLCRLEYLESPPETDDDIAYDTAIGYCVGSIQANIP